MRSVAPILIVEDDPVMCRTLSDALKDEGYVVVTASTLSEARGTLARARPSVMILDLTLPDDFGGDLLNELADNADAPPTVILSVFHLASMVAARYNVELVRKPFEIDTLMAAIRRALEQERRPSRVAASE